MKKFLKRFLLISAILLLLVAGAASIILNLYADEINERILGLVKDQVTTELKVGGFDLSLFSSFPEVSANLNEVEIEDIHGKELLKAEQLALRFKLFSLFGSHIQISSVKLSNAYLRVRIDRHGKVNYDIFKKTESDRDAKQNDRSVAIDIRRALLEEIKLDYHDYHLGQELRATLSQADMRGKLSANRFLIKADARLYSRHFETKGNKYLHHTWVTLDGKGIIDLDQGLYDVRKVLVGVGPNVFEVDGTIATVDGISEYDLSVKNHEGNLAALFHLLPAHIRTKFGDLDSRGNFSLDANLKGKGGDGKLPGIDARVSLSDGRLSSSRLMDDFKDITLEANFTNGKHQNAKTSVLKISRLEGHFLGQRISGSLTARGLDDPHITLNLDATLPVHTIYAALDNPNITDGGGLIRIRDLALDGRVSDMVRMHKMYRVKASGTIAFEDARLEVQGNRLEIEKGELQLAGNDVRVSELKLHAPGTDILFAGSATNLLPILLADSINSRGAQLGFDAKLVSDELNIDRLLLALDLKSAGELEDAQEVLTPREKAAWVKRREAFTRKLKGQFEADIGQFNYGKIVGEDFVGKLKFGNNELSIDGTTKAMGGTFKLGGSLYFEQKPLLKAELEASKVDVGELFRQTNNFGQKSLKHENLSGTLEAKVAIDARFDEEGGLLQDKLHVLAGIGITDGQLKNWEMLDKLSAVVKERDLQKIQFSDLQNFMEIKNSRIRIPVMFVQSNAINLTISGEHGFDNTYRYNIKANVLQAMGQKFRRHDNNLRPIKARKEGFVNVYYQVRSDGNEVVAESAKRDVKADFEESNKLRREIYLALQSIFGYVKLVDEPIAWRDIPEYQADPDDDSPEFIDWEEEGGSE